MQKEINCPYCGQPSKPLEWVKKTEELQPPDVVGIQKGYGSMNFLYHCPRCEVQVNGRKLKAFNEAIPSAGSKNE